MAPKLYLEKKFLQKKTSFIFSIRKLFYKFLNKISETKLTENTTGSGIFDKTIIE
jgi:hypothetical protein